ncbi:hypothetical protein V6N11_027939 [Hibiscus sabdariffa]|uniref:C3H1-type domain-containing protein n=1 Tax=Hibiscus sabdariffa TaxID=183260 RepID=A0ABR2NZN4_9ROSI
MLSLIQFSLSIGESSAVTGVRSGHDSGDHSRDHNHSHRDVGGNRRVFNRPGIDSSKNQKVCFHWRAGKCTRFPCPFLHSEQSHPSGSATVNGSGTHKRFADDSGFSGDGFSMLNHLDGHQKLVSGIVLPAGMDKLFTGSKDETLRAWDTNSGQCTAVINLGGEVGCMIGEGPWLFVGIPNAVKVWNTQTNQELTLGGPVGQVYAMVVFTDLLFAGTQEAILVWKFSAVTNTFEPVASLKGHTLPVVSLIVGANRLYSASADHSIKVWSLETLQCIQTLTGHNDVVMSLLCWDQFLLSCSLDKTIKVWVATENGNLEVAYTHNEENGVLNLRGMPDLESKPVLLCACNNNYVRLFDLPSFSERGRIFAKQEIRAVEVGPGGLFFTGDGTGFKVWKWAEPVALS